MLRPGWISCRQTGFRLNAVDPELFVSLSSIISSVWDGYVIVLASRLFSLNLFHFFLVRDERNLIIGTFSSDAAC